jgi:hypothetical protein
MWFRVGRYQSIKSRAPYVIIIVKRIIVYPKTGQIISSHVHRVTMAQWYLLYDLRKMPTPFLRFSTREHFSRFLSVSDS